MERGRRPAAHEADDARWNEEVRPGETEAERADRNLRDLLQELRITLTGSQILFAFLLVVPFSGAFARTTGFERGLYLSTLVTSALSAGLLVAPAAMHRIVFRRHLKDWLVAMAGRLALAAQALFALALGQATLLVGDAVASLAVGIGIAGLVTGWFVFWFFALPLLLRGRLAPEDEGRTSAGTRD